MTELEIERKYLLDGVPDLPAGAVPHRMEQGYFEDATRLRREIAPDGSIRCTRTVKRGQGLVREEDEQAISEAEFGQLWPDTEGRRLRKTRHRVVEGAFAWEIDVYEDLDLVLAEVELPTAETRADPPAWLVRHIVREVTDEPEYQNYRLALRRGPLADS